MKGKAKKTVQPVNAGYNPYIRRNRITFMLNDKEMAALGRLYARYKVKNKSKFLREAVMSAVLKRLEEDYPSLFDK
ncbi:MAG: hypothetical protein MJ009_05230 [Paludibacteraceae bacterium]|nr:hypothetical protein [Paludibacteraceae bacterium]